MRKINSIGYGHKVLGVAAVFLIVLPLCCHFFFALFRVELLNIMASASFGIGLFILLFFAGLLCIEFFQDSTINRQYAALRKAKVRTGNGMYECQSCGYRQIGAADKACPVCGVRFVQESRKQVKNDI